MKIRWQWDGSCNSIEIPWKWIRSWKYYYTELAWNNVEICGSWKWYGKCVKITWK